MFGHRLVEGLRRGAAALAGVVALAAAGPTAAVASTDTLSATQTLTAGQQIDSLDGHYALVMESAGDLVLYSGPRVVWSTPTAGDVGVYAVMQPQGNLVLYDQVNQAVWSSNSTTIDCPRLVLQDDGVSVVYGLHAAWATHTVQDVLEPGDLLQPGWSIYSSDPEDYRLTMQTDGNLVLYDAAGQPLFNSRTERNPGAYAAMQGDGNLVVYSATGHALWASDTHGHPGASLTLQGGGNAVVSLGSTTLWSSATAGKGSGGSLAPHAPPLVACPPPPTPPPPPPRAVQTVPVPTPVPQPAARVT